MKKLLLAAAALVALASPASAFEVPPTLYDGMSFRSDLAKFVPPYYPEMPPIRHTLPADQMVRGHFVVRSHGAANGSIVGVWVNQDHTWVDFKFVWPSPALAAIGVKPGSLFAQNWAHQNGLTGGRSRIANSSINGFTVVLYSPCARGAGFLYPMYMVEDKRNKAFIFSGPEPVIRSSTCRTISNYDFTWGDDSLIQLQRAEDYLTN
jgi:hypothetical protein